MTIAPVSATRGPTPYIGPVSGTWPEPSRPRPGPLAETTIMPPTDPLPDQPDSGSVPRRRLLGSYHTPDGLAAVLVRWALADGDGPILDPSYGGCAFLEAAAQVFSEGDPSTAGTRVYGVDIDSWPSSSGPVV